MSLFVIIIKSDNEICTCKSAALAYNLNLKVATNDIDSGTTTPPMHPRDAPCGHLAWPGELETRRRLEEQA